MTASEVAGEEAVHTSVEVEVVFGSVQSMALVRVNDELDRDTSFPERGCHPLGLDQLNAGIVRAMGDRVAFSPPLIISDAEIDAMFDRFAYALSETEKAAAAGAFSRN